MLENVINLYPVLAGIVTVIIFIVVTRNNTVQNNNKLKRLEIQIELHQKCINDLEREKTRFTEALERSYVTKDNCFNNASCSLKQ